MHVASEDAHWAKVKAEMAGGRLPNQGFDARLARQATPSSRLVLNLRSHAAVVSVYSAVIVSLGPSLETAIAVGRSECTLSLQRLCRVLDLVVHGQSLEASGSGCACILLRRRI